MLIQIPPDCDLVKSSSSLAYVTTEFLKIKNTYGRQDMASVNLKIFKRSVV